MADAARVDAINVAIEEVREPPATYNDSSILWPGWAGMQDARCKMQNAPAVAVTQASQDAQWVPAKKEGAALW